MELAEGRVAALAREAAEGAVEGAERRQGARLAALSESLGRRLATLEQAARTGGPSASMRGAWGGVAVKMSLGTP